MRQWLNQHGERPLLWLAAAFVLAVVLRRVFLHSETAHWGPQAAFAIDHAYQAVCGLWLWRYAGRHRWLWLALGAAAGLPAVWLFFVLERAGRERGHA